VYQKQWVSISFDLRPILRDGLESGEDSCRLQVVSCRLWSRKGGSGFFDDFRRRAGVAAFGEFGGGEEFGVAVGAVAGAEEVEKAVLGDRDGARWSSC